MALTQTTISGAITATATSLKLTSAGSVAVGQYLRVDSEYMLVQSIDASPVIKVERGQYGTLGVAHDTLAAAVYGPGGDFNPFPPYEPIQSIGANGAITIPQRSAIVFITKATAGTITIANPPLDADGLELTIQSLTAAAHVVSCPDATGYNGAGTTADDATFGGAVGDNFRIIASRGQWNVLYLRNVTIG